MCSDNPIPARKELSPYLFLVYNSRSVKGKPVILSFMNSEIFFKISSQKNIIKNKYWLYLNFNASLPLVEGLYVGDLRELWKKHMNAIKKEGQISSVFPGAHWGSRTHS